MRTQAYRIGVELCRWSLFVFVAVFLRDSSCFVYRLVIFIFFTVSSNIELKTFEFQGLSLLRFTGEVPRFISSLICIMLRFFNSGHFSSGFLRYVFGWVGFVLSCILCRGLEGTGRVFRVRLDRYGIYRRYCLS